jgi:PTS system nitrogen regulatory IIA component
MTKLTNFLKPELVYFIDCETRDEAIKLMSDELAKQGKIQDSNEYYNAILDREKIVSTGIGMGVAIPHAKLTSVEDFFIAIGVLTQGVQWNALDGGTVRLIFMIGGPDDKQTAYLQILSSLTMAIKDEERRKKILTLNSPEAIIQLFEEA